MALRQGDAAGTARQTFIQSTLQDELGPPHGDTGPLEPYVDQDITDGIYEQAMVTTDVTVHDAIWKRTYGGEGDQRSGSGNSPLTVQDRNWHSTPPESDSEQSCSSQDTMILIGASCAADNHTEQQISYSGPGPLQPPNVDIKNKGELTLTLPSSSVDYQTNEGSPDTSPRGSGASRTYLTQGAQSLSHDSKPRYVLSKAPGLSPRKMGSPRGEQLHRPNFPSPDSEIQFEQTQVPSEGSIVEVREGSPEPEVPHNELYLPEPWAPINPDHLAVHKTDDEDKDDGYDSPGGQSSETSSTESNANRAQGVPAPLKSILPKSKGERKESRTPKRVRFETDEDDVEEKSSSPEPLPPPPENMPAYHVKKTGHSFLFEQGVKIPSFREMNKRLRQQRSGSPASSTKPSQSSSLERQLQMLALEQEQAEAEARKETEQTPEDCLEAILTPSGVSESRQILYSSNTHTVVQHAITDCDSETGETEQDTAPVSEAREGSPSEGRGDDSFFSFIQQRNAGTSQRHLSPPPSDHDSDTASNSSNASGERRSQGGRRVHFAEPLIVHLADSVKEEEEEEEEERKGRPEDAEKVKGVEEELQDISLKCSVNQTSEGRCDQNFYDYSKQDNVPSSTLVVAEPKLPDKHQSVAIGHSGDYPNMKNHMAIDNQRFIRRFEETDLDSFTTTAASIELSSAYIRRSDTQALMFKLGQNKTLEQRVGLNRSLLHSTGSPNMQASGRLSPEQERTMTKDDSYVKLRKQGANSGQQRPVSDYGFHTLIGTNQPDAAGPHSLTQEVSQPKTMSVHQHNRPQFARSSDIYSLLQKNRQNPFQPMPNTVRPQSPQLHPHIQQKHPTSQHHTPGGAFAERNPTNVSWDMHQGYSQYPVASHGHHLYDDRVSPTSSHSGSSDGRHRQLYPENIPPRFEHHAIKECKMGPSHQSMYRDYVAGPYHPSGHVESYLHQEVKHRPVWNRDESYGWTPGQKVISKSTAL